MTRHKMHPFFLHRISRYQKLLKRKIDKSQPKQISVMLHNILNKTQQNQKSRKVVTEKDNSTNQITQTPTQKRNNNICNEIKFIKFDCSLFQPNSDKIKKKENKKI